MDFTYHYSEEQERFRKEVRAWLEKNIPEEMKEPIDGRDLNDEQYERYYYFWREKRREMAAKGWLWPTLPKQFDGGGLTPEHETILGEEFARYQASYGNGTTAFLVSTLLVWATEEQRQKFLVPILKHERICIQALTEPQSGSDLANILSTAVRDGDDWIINGQKAFQGHPPDADWIMGPILTDPGAPRHRNLGFFVIPANDPGVIFQRTRTMNGDRQNFIFYDNVRVPGDHLIGGDHQGWQVVNTTLEQEHGGRGRVAARDEDTENLLAYLQGLRAREDLAQERPIIHQKAMENYIASHLDAFFSDRNYWMYQTRQEMSYHGSQQTLWSKVTGVERAERGRDIMNLYAMLGTRDPRALFGGRPETFQRSSLTRVHPGGTVEIQKVIIARRIGISRTPERAPPTPATATSFAS